MAVEWPDLQEAVAWSLRMLDTWDRRLLRYRVNERSVSHKFAEYFRCFFDKNLNQRRDIPYLSVDCEYNRHRRDPKRLPWKYEVTGKTNELYYTPNPDMNVHQRGNDRCNLFVVEMKLDWNADIGAVLLDKQKLAAYMDFPVNYSVGLFLCLGYSGKHLRVEEAKLIERNDDGNYNEGERIGLWNDCTALLTTTGRSKKRLITKPLGKRDSRCAEELIQGIERVYQFRDVRREIV